MKKILVALLALISGSIYAQPQDVINDEALLKKYLGQSIFEIDSSADAVVLYEKGTVIYRSTGLTYKIDRTIKILNANALDLATIIVPAHEKTYFSKVIGLTYNLENGNLVNHSIEKSDRFSENITDNQKVFKFNLPSVRVGSIIHYSYTQEMPATIFIPTWYFQGMNPKLCSIFETVISDQIVYTSMDRTEKPLKEVADRAMLKNCDDCYFEQSLKGEIESIKIRKNIKGYSEEPYMLSELNYIERAKTHVTALNDQGITKSIFKSWDYLNDDLFYRGESLGGQIFAQNNFLNETIAALNIANLSKLEKSKAIFRYVRDSITVHESTAMNQDDIKDIVKKKLGSRRGINLLLCAMLRKSGIDGEPVLIATKENECLNVHYADFMSINYILGKVDIDGKTYYLDASDKFLSFGQLPLYCYNGMGRTVNKKSQSIYLTPDSILDKNQTVVNITPASEQNKMNVKLEISPGIFTSHSFRTKWQNDSSTAHSYILQNMGSGLKDFNIAKCEVKNLSSPDDPLKIIIEGSINLDKSEMIYISPYFHKFFPQNPFIATTRMFPIVMENRQQHVYILSLTMPQEYTIDDYPKSIAFKYEGVKSTIDYKSQLHYNQEKNLFKVQNQFSSNGINFDIEEYQELKNFYDQIIQEQSKLIVVKATK